MTALARLTVLVVDDNKAMRSITMSVLNGLGFRQVLQAGDGAAALDILREHRIDIAIVDFKMTPMNGFEFTDLVRNSPDSADPYLPIIMLTGHANKVRVMQARDVGVTEFLAKPITAKSLTDRIESVILRPRSFLKMDGYFGPDRRRSTQKVAGQGRRRSDPLRDPVPSGED